MHLDESIVPQARDAALDYMMLDAWVANQDRHHQNWGATWLEPNLRLAPTVVENFEEVAVLLDVHTGDTKIVDDQQTDPSQLLEQLGKTAVGVGDRQSPEELWSYLFFGLPAPVAPVMRQLRLSFTHGEARSCSIWARLRARGRRKSISSSVHWILNWAYLTRALSPRLSFQSRLLHAIAEEGNCSRFTHSCPLAFSISLLKNTMRRL